MADVISFANLSQLLEMIQQGDALVSGMSAAEAQAALGATANSGLYVFNGTTAQGAANIINFPNAAGAAEAAAEFVQAGGTTAASGAATAATGAAETTANFAVIEGAGGAGTSGVAGLLATPLSTAFAAIAPLAGVAIGAGAYEVISGDTSFFQRFVDAFKDTYGPLLLGDNYVPCAVVKDEQQNRINTYYSKQIIDAIKATLKEMEVGGISEVPSIPSRWSDLNNYIASPISLAGTNRLYIFYGGTKPAWMIYSASNAEKAALFIKETSSTSISFNVIFASRNPFTFGYTTSLISSDVPIDESNSSQSYTYDGKTVHFAGVRSSNNFAGGDGYTPSVPTTELKSIISSVAIYQKIAWLLMYESVEGGFPEGTSKWEGDSYPSNPKIINALSGYDESDPEQPHKPIFKPYYPVSIPIGDPGVSNNPAVNPDPTYNPNPAPAIQPYINPAVNPETVPETVPAPSPAPLPNPVPTPQPVPEPDIDPSQPDDTPTPENPTDPSGPTDGGTGGTPTIPVIPSLPSSGSGLLHVYNPTQAQIDSFGSWLWQTWSNTSVWETIQKLFNDPMDGVIGLHELYATPSTNGTGTIKCGYLDSQISSKLVGNRYTEINCGSVVVEEYYQNYLDYTPYTQCYIYLPFIGIMPVSADDIIGNAVNIKYHIDSYTGCCIAVVSVARQGYTSPVYQFEGNCAVEIPITSGYQSALMAGLLAVAGTAISGNPSVGLTAAHVGRAGLGKNAVQHSGSFGSSFGAMGVKIPYIIVRRPVQKKVLNYSKSYGYPAHKMVYVGNCQGYLRAKEVRVTSTTATNIEKDMIIMALKEGVYVR